MQNMNAYYDFSGQKFGHPLSLSINGFDRQVFSQQTSLELSYVLEGRYEVITEGFSHLLNRHELALIAPGEIHMIRKAPDAPDSVILTVHIDFERMPEALVGQVDGLFSTMVCTEAENAALLGRLRQTLGRLLRLLTLPEHSLFQLNARMMELADRVFHADGRSVLKVQTGRRKQKNRYTNRPENSPFSGGLQFCFM